MPGGLPGGGGMLKLQCDWYIRRQIRLLKIASSYYNLLNMRNYSLSKSYYRLFMITVIIYNDNTFPNILFKRTDFFNLKNVGVQIGESTVVSTVKLFSIPINPVIQ